MLKPPQEMNRERLQGILHYYRYNGFHHEIKVKLNTKTEVLREVYRGIYERLSKPLPERADRVATNRSNRDSFYNDFTDSYPVEYVAQMFPKSYAEILDKGYCDLFWYKYPGEFVYALCCTIPAYCTYPVDSCLVLNNQILFDQ